MKKMVLFALIFGIIANSYIQASDAEALWWDTYWSYVHPITITNSSALNNYPVNILLNSSHIPNLNWSNNGNDLRFTYDDNTTIVPYWIESWLNQSTSNASVWVKTNKSQVNMWYSNPSATSQSNISAIFGTGIVGRWGFSEGSGTSSRDGAGTNNITLYGSPAFLAGKYGYSLNLTGSSNPTPPPNYANATTTGLPLAASARTIMVWAKTTQSTISSGVMGYGTFGSGRTGVVLMFGTSGKVTFSSYNENADSGNGYNDGNWHLLTGVYNGTHMTVYVDKVKGQITASAFNTTNASLKIGNAYYDGFNGMVDEPRIYNRVLSEAEINATYDWNILNYSIGTEQTQPNTAPTITLNFPSDASWTNSGTVNHQFTPITDDGFSNCSVWNNATGIWALNQPNTSAIVNNSINNISITYSTDGTYLWNIQCYDNSNFSFSNFSINNRTVNIDTLSPSLTSYTPSTGAVSVDTNTTIILMFSEDMNQSTFSGVILNDSSNVSVSMSQLYNNTTHTAVFQPLETLDNNKGYTVILTGLTDLAGNLLLDTSWSFITGITYNIALSKNSIHGWNLISLPVIPTNTSPESVLSNVINDIENVWTYNGTDWLMYSPTAPSDLNDMTTGYGYWINYNGSISKTISGSGSLYLEGTSVPPSRTLPEGWNLIGYYQKGLTSEIQSKCALSTLTPDINDWTQAWWQTPIMGYDNTGKTFTEVSYSGIVTPGQGYWILMKSNHIYAPGLGAKNTTTTDCI